MKKFYHISPLVLQTFIWIPCRIYFKLFWTYSVKGLENLKELKYNKNINSSKGSSRRGVIFAVNHSSELDPIMIPASLPFLSYLMPMFYVSREQKFYSSSGWKQHIYGGYFFNIWGAYTAYTGLKNYDLSLKHHVNILNDGKSICIFPEGRKTKDGTIGEGKSGISFLSHRTNTPIVPVKIEGLYKPLAQKSKSGKTILNVIFGKPIYPKDLFGDKKEVEPEELKDKGKVIMSKIREL